MPAPSRLYLVTGGCGFIGSHLCEALLLQGHRVRVIDDLSTGRRAWLPAGCELIEACVTDAVTVREAMAEADGCFHLAAIASVQRCNEAWLASHRVNLSATVGVFDAARARADRPAVPVVYASSAAVYGDAGDGPLGESAPARPVTAYGADKLAGELQAAVAAGIHGVPAVGLRLFNVYGPRQGQGSGYAGVISAFLRRLAAGEPLTVFGDGGQARDFVHVSDAVGGFLAAMDARLPGAEVFNLCTGRATKVVDLALLLGALLGRRPAIDHAPARPGDIRLSLGDPRQARRRLGHSARVDLRDGLAGLVAELDGPLGLPSAEAAA